MNAAFLSETFRQALDCIANWPDMYEEEAHPQVTAFAAFVATADVEKKVHAVQLAQAAREFDQRPFRGTSAAADKLEELRQYIGGWND